MTTLFVRQPRLHQIGHIELNIKIQQQYSQNSVTLRKLKQPSTQQSHETPSKLTISLSQDPGEQLGLVAQPGFNLAWERMRQITARANGFPYRSISDLKISNDKYCLSLALDTFTWFCWWLFHSLNKSKSFNKNKRKKKKLPQ